MAVAVFVASAPSAFAQAGLLVPTSVGRPDSKVVSLREMAIDAEIVRGYARVNIRQVFENHTDAPQEGTYRFALPPSAAVGDFAVWDGLVRIPGIILEKRRARNIYRDLTTQRIDPGLLQQGEEEDRGDGLSPARPSGGALFSVTVAPIPPRSTKRLEIQFQQEAPVLGGEGEFRLALRPPDGTPPRARVLSIRVRSGDGSPVAVNTAMILTTTGDTVSFDGRDVSLDKDLVVRFRPQAGAPPLRVSAFRTPDGRLPDGVALAPWERASEIPPEKDGFFLLEYQAAGESPVTAGTASVKRRMPGRFVVLFDTSLSQRFAGLESSYALVIDVLRSLIPEDRFALVAFDRTPDAAAQLEAATPAAIDAALNRLRERALGPGTDVASALARGRSLGGDGVRLLLLTDGQVVEGSQALRRAGADAPLFAAVGGSETLESIRNASVAILTPQSSSPERRAFLEALLSGDAKPRPAPMKANGDLPFRVTGGDAKIRDVYPVLVQPVAQGSLSGWIGRYGTPQPNLRFALSEGVAEVGAGPPSVEAALPETALEARDLPRRWARARVDDLLRRIEAEGENRAWIDEIIDLSRRYKFVTPYTAFLAAPRALLRPRRIQPGDPVLRVECDPRTVSATALFPFGLRLPLVRRPRSNLWEGRFLVPTGLKDGRHRVRILIKDAGGSLVSESKDFVIDGTAPRVVPEIPAAVHVGDEVRVAARADEDVIVLTARFGDSAPVPLRWDPATRRSVGTWRVPSGFNGKVDVLFEAMDQAKNHAFARSALEVRP